MRDQTQEEAYLKLCQGEGNIKVVLVSIDDKIVDMEGQRRLNPYKSRENTFKDLIKE